MWSLWALWALWPRRTNREGMAASAEAGDDEEPTAEDEATSVPDDGSEAEALEGVLYDELEGLAGELEEIPDDGLDDDTEEALTKRLETFGKNRDAVAAAFSSIAITVDGNRAPDDVWADVEAFLDK